MNTLLTVSAATSGTITAIDTQQDQILVHDAGVTTTLTVTFPPTPIMGQLFCFTTVGGVVALTLSAVATIVAALTSAAAGGNGTWVYTGTKWARLR